MCECWKELWIEFSNYISLDYVQSYIYICKIIYKIYTMVHDVYTYCMKCKALHRRHMDDLYDAVYSTYILFSGRWVSN